MRLLIVTQVVDTNDSNLGFFHRWIEEFAKHCESIIVICLKEGQHRLPRNVSVYSLGKPSFAKASEGEGRRFLLRIRYALRFRKLIREHSGEYDAVFVHMNPEYVLLGGFFWRTRSKTIALWYVHKSVTWTLRIALRMADVVFTASPESFRLTSPKVRIVGHGIDTSRFLPRSGAFANELRIITVGRVAESKHIKEMLGVLDELTRRHVPFTFTIVGEPITAADHMYAKELRETVVSKPYAGSVHFVGAVPYADIPTLLSKADVMLHMSTTGSIDKAVLDALAAGTRVVSTSEAFKAAIPGVMPVANDPTVIATAVQKGNANPETLQTYVREHYALEKLVASIVDNLSKQA